MNENDDKLNDLKIKFLYNYDKETKNNLIGSLKTRKNLLLVRLKYRICLEIER